MLQITRMLARRAGRVQSQDLFEQLNAILISKFISYASCRVPEEVLMKTIPEAANLYKLFHRKAIHEWRKRMNDHNLTIERGERMRLLATCKNMDRLKFDSLDTYMLTMYGEVYAEALLSIASFGERVQKAMEQNQEDGVWCIQMPFLITNEKWTCLCKRVRFLVRIIKRKVLSLESCPSHEKLNLAVQKLSLIF